MCSKFDASNFEVSSFKVQGLKFQNVKFQSLKFEVSNCKVQNALPTIFFNFAWKCDSVGDPVQQSERHLVRSGIPACGRRSVPARGVRFLLFSRQGKLPIQTPATVNVGKCIGNNYLSSIIPRSLLLSAPVSGAPLRRRSYCRSSRCRRRNCSPSSGLRWFPLGRPRPSGTGPSPGKRSGPCAGDVIPRGPCS